jgi:outer membrane immunogenic protein
MHTPHVRALILVGSLALLCVGNVSRAAASQWSGLYLGLFAGYDDASDAWTPDAASGAASLSPEGVIGGGLIGANFQYGLVVIGFEGDVMFADFTDVESCENATQDCSIDARLMGSLRARGGIAFDRLLLYATGGPAFRYAQATSSGPGGSSDSQTLGGWTIGIGAETSLSETVGVGLEYRHTDYGQADFALATGSSDVNFRTDEVTLRLTLHFD